MVQVCYSRVLAHFDGVVSVSLDSLCIGNLNV